jgi:hypothetical protein
MELSSFVTVVTVITAFLAAMTALIAELRRWSHDNNSVQKLGVFRRKGNKEVRGTKNV